MHASTTDPDAKLARKGNGQEAKLACAAKALMENRNGLLVDVCVAPTSLAGIPMVVAAGPHHIALGAWRAAKAPSRARQRHLRPSLASP